MNVTDPLEDVTLFKLNHNLGEHKKNFTTRGLKEKLGGKHRLYTNGKSVARLDAPGLKQHGPHFWIGYKSERWIDPTMDDDDKGNRSTAFRSTIAEDARLLHFPYTRVKDVSSKANSSCPGEDYRRAASINNRTKLKECFVIDFDMAAFVAATSGDDERIRTFFRDNLLLRGTPEQLHQAIQEGSLVRDTTVRTSHRSHRDIVRTVLGKMRSAVAVGDDPVVRMAAAMDEAIKAP